MAIAGPFAGFDFPKLAVARRIHQAIRQQHIVSLGASTLALALGSTVAYGLSRFNYRFGRWGNKDISFFFLSQLILPPVVLAMPFLVLYKALALLDTRMASFSSIR